MSKLRELLEAERNAPPPCDTSRAKHLNIPAHGIPVYCPACGSRSIIARIRNKPSHWCRRCRHEWNIHRPKRIRNRAQISSTLPAPPADANTPIFPPHALKLSCGHDVTFLSNGVCLACPGTPPTPVE